MKLHGFSASIVSDSDRVFISNFWRELFRIHGTNLKRSTAYPQTNRQSEVVNKTLETYLRSFIQGKPKTWIQWLPWAEHWYNTSKHGSTKFTPFQALYEREPPHLVQSGRGTTTVFSLEEQLQERNAILDELKFNLIRAQQKMKSLEDRHHKDVSFLVGEKVYLKLQPYRQQSLARRTYEKLASRYYRPYEILQKVGSVAYHLQLPESAKIHLVFHVSQLKKAIGPHPSSPTFPSQLTAYMELLVEPKALLGVRSTVASSNKPTVVLIRWKGLPITEATWEDIETMIHTFPPFTLRTR